ncbi:MAG: hypothetical protein VW268_04745 [Rhodospirillaceae bacterium]
MFTEPDLLRRVVAESLDPAKTPVGDVITKRIIALDADRRGFEVAKLVHDRGIRHVAVTGLGQRGFGIVSIRDFPPADLAEYGRKIEFEEHLWEGL